MFEGLAGMDMSRYLLAIGVVGLGLLGLIGVMWVIRNRPSSPFVRGGRARLPRLAVVDATAVDARRRIILVRRDNVEHLIMIGGPTDIVIESRISADSEPTQPLNVAQAEQQEALPKPVPALELASPPQMVTEQPSTASAQTQSAPPLKAKMWPTEPKPAAPVAQPAPTPKSTSPSAIQQVPSAGSSPLATQQMTTTIVAEPDMEIRNPYLEAETAVTSPTPIPVRPATNTAKPAPAPVAALHKWLRPEQTEKPSISAPPTVLPKETQPNPQVVASKPSSINAALGQNPSVPLQKTNPESARAPENKVVAPAVPVDLESLMSGDFLDAARDRVLSPSSENTGKPENQPAPQMSVSPPRVSPSATPKSDFANILDEEMKTGLPENRFDRPRVDPNFAQALQPQNQRRETVLPAEKPAAAAMRSTAPVAVSLTTAPEPLKTPNEDGLTSRTIADILEVSKFRVMEPGKASVELKADTKSEDREATAITNPAFQSGERSEAELSDHIAAEFEKMWDKPAADLAPEVEHRAKVSELPDAPIVRLDDQKSLKNEKHDILGRDIRHDPLLDIHMDEQQKQANDDLLSLDDEMARVLGEFSLDRKN